MFHNRIFLPFQMRFFGRPRQGGPVSFIICNLSCTDKTFSHKKERGCPAFWLLFFCRLPFRFLFNQKEGSGMENLPF